MINKQRTIELFGYDPDTLKSKSHKKIVRICNGCGREQIVIKISSNNLCGSCAQLGKNNHNYGKSHSEKTKQKIRDNNPHLSMENHPMWGKYHTEKTKQKMRCERPCMQGENHWNWQGGISNEPYCKLFNNVFKQKIRDQYHNKCFLCRKTKEENGSELDVHHVNYNKDCLCGIPCEFVPLCRSCHGKTNFNRKYWEDMIMCYLYPNRYFMVDI